MSMPMANQLTNEQRLAQIPAELPAALPPFGQYVPAVLHGTQLWVGGHFGTHPDGSIHAGRCGQDVSTSEAQAAARSAAFNLLATVRGTVGSLDRVVRVAHVYGVVNATPDFVEHTSVIDAASDVFVEVFGEAGRHARLAVGVSSLPANLVLEIQATLIVAPVPATG
jgi:enamine deaminase RidA (YjgF/YER057c/UK114 family)